MTEKISADDYREKNVKEIQRTITEQKKELTGATTQQRGSGTDNPKQPSESIGTIKKNIARGKTVLNEKLENDN